MTLLETERLILRPLVESDAEELFRIQSKGETMRYLGGSSVPIEKIRALIKLGLARNYDGRLGMRAVILKSSGKLVGRCGLFDSVVDGRPEIEISYLIDSDVAGNELATEAGAELVRYGQNVLLLDRIVALISPENKASIRVAEKLGFNCERERAEPSEFGPVLIYSKQSAEQ